MNISIYVFNIKIYISFTLNTFINMNDIFDISIYINIYFIYICDSHIIWYIDIYGSYISKRSIYIVDSTILLKGVHQVVV